VRFVSNEGFSQSVRFKPGVGSQHHSLGPGIQPKRRQFRSHADGLLANDSHIVPQRVKVGMKLSLE